MARKGLNVKELSKIQRLLNLGLTNRQIARAKNIHRNTINKYVEKINNNFVSAVETKVSTAIHWGAGIDWEKVRQEFLSGVPLNIIFEELFELQKLSVQYPGFWKQANKKINLSKATMVKIHRPGERADYETNFDLVKLLNEKIGYSRFLSGIPKGYSYRIKIRLFIARFCDF